MADLRNRVPNIRRLQQALGKDYSHIWHVLKGETQPSVALAKRIEIATDGLIRWTEFFDGPVPLDMEAAGRETTPAIVAVNQEACAAPADAPGCVLVVPSKEPDRKHHGTTAA